MSLTAHQRPHRGASDVWLTPPEIIDAVGPFDLDPCAAPVPRPWPTADRHITPPDDGLTAEWAGFVWCNPPFGPEAGRWLDRMADHGHGIALCPARTETRWFVNTVWRRASSVLFLHGRPHFHYPDGTRGKANSGAPIVLVAYGPAADARLASCGLAGSFVPVPAPAPTDGEPVSALDRITVNAAEVTCASADEGARQRPGPPGHRGAEQTAATLAYTARWIDAQPVRGDGPPSPAPRVDGLNADERWIIGCALEGFANGESEAAATTYKDSPDEAAELTRQADVARSLMARFAASPSTPADPRPTDLTGSEA